MVLAAKVVFVEEALADAMHSDKKTSAKSFLNLYRAHSCIPRIAFHDGSRPGTVRLKINSPGLSGVASNKAV
jgi:hypothetical protein